MYDIKIRIKISLFLFKNIFFFCFLNLSQILFEDDFF